MITTVDELLEQIVDNHWVPDDTEVRRRREDGVTTITVIDLETGEEMLRVQEERTVVYGEVIADPESGIEGGNSRGLLMSAAG